MINPEKLWTSPQLPTLPTVAVRLLELSKDPEAEINEFIQVIKTDPAISAKILKSTNSSFFGVSSEVTSIDRAVPLLGTTMVTSLALSFSLSEAAMSSGPLSEYYQNYWMQSVVQGVTAECLGESLKQGLDSEFFLAGLLMDLGRLAILKVAPDEYLEVLSRTETEQRPLCEVEVELLGVHHVEVGTRLMESWRLPGLLIDGIRYHHATREELAAQAQGKHFDIIKTLAVASAVGEYFCTSNKGAALRRLRQLSTEFLTRTEPELQNLLERVSKKIEESQSIFAINYEELSDPGALIAEANEQLVQLALRQHVASTQAEARHRVAEKLRQELESKNQQLQEEAVHDPLTRVYTRRFFEEVLQEEIAEATQNGTPVGVFFCDLDHFKPINDRYGHRAGDRILQHVAATMQSNLRDADVLARFGGEEFVVLVSRPTEASIGKLAERIRRGVEESTMEVDGETIHVTVSIGAVFTIPERNEAGLADGLIAAADDAMYRVKRSGRNHFQMTLMLSETERELLKRSTRMRFSRWLVEQKMLDISTVTSALVKLDDDKISIGELSRRSGLLTPLQIEEIATRQETRQERFGQIALRLGLLTCDDLAKLLAIQREDPRHLANILIAQGVLEKDYADTVLQLYLRELEFAETMLQPDDPAAQRA